MRRSKRCSLPWIRPKALLPQGLLLWMTGAFALQAGKKTVSHHFLLHYLETLTDGENLLSDIGILAGADLGSLNEKIQSVNGKVDSAMLSINSVIQLNEKIIDLLSQLDSARPGAALRS